MMHGGINVTENLEEEKKFLNNDKPDINRGVELLLRRRNKPEKPKTFQVKFGNGSTFPQVVIDSTNLGGCSETVQYLKEKKLV